MTTDDESIRAEPSAQSGNDDRKERAGHSTDVRFPIVGAGASAGGLEAFTRLLEHLPAETGMGFVLVQHLDPTHESALTGLLAKATSMPVREADDGVRVEPNCVYVIPPDALLSISDGMLRLEARTKSAGSQHAIDFFLESLAKDSKEKAIAVILSGTASDGTRGTEAIKGEGGITFAQDESAKFDSMPRNAIAAGCVDFVRSPAAIAEELVRIARHPHFARACSGEKDDGEEGGDRAVEENDGFRKILLWLRDHRGVDFSLYKPNTIQRRVARRLVLNKFNTQEEYLQFLRESPEELDALYSDALIGVTGFFRDPDAFEALKEEVFPRLVEAERDGPIRIWVAGCSTGQEVYSIAMAFTEFAEQEDRTDRIQIFATDVNEALLEKARAGFYPKTLLTDVSEDRLSRFFTEADGGYRIKKQLREMVTFARHNLINDPPFSRMDLIGCRNLMIYFEPSLQKKVLHLFHYALKADGVLFLGASESIRAYTDLFEAVNPKQRIFRKKPVPTPPLHRFAPESPPVKTDKTAAPPPGAEALDRSAQREADRVTLKRFAPPAVVIDENSEIIQFRGPTSRYLEPRTGKASFQILNMAREGLMLPLRDAIHTAREEDRVVRKEGVRFYVDGESRRVTIEAVPLKHVKEPCCLVLFEENRNSEPPGREQTAQPGEPPAAETAPRNNDDMAEKSRLVAELEKELAEARDYIHSLHEQYEATTDQLQASNEEAQSANEELQSINEELETSKEELESTNEELTTVNEEMTNRNEELDRLSTDLVNLQDSVNMAVVLLDRNLIVRRFTPMAEEKLNLVASDIGRPITSIRMDFEIPDLKEWIAGCVDSGAEREQEVRDDEGRCYSVRARPYRKSDDSIDGAVFMLVDIDSLKRKQEELKDAHHFTDAIVSQVPPLLVLDTDLRVTTANDSFLEHFKVEREKTENCLVYELGNGQWDIPALRKALEEILPEQRGFYDFEVEHDFESIGRRVILMTAHRLDHLQRILVSIEDVTEERETARQLRELNQTLEERVAERTAVAKKRAEQLQRISLALTDTEHRERHRLAHLLHDDVQQLLVAARMQLSGIKHEEELERTASVQDLLDQALDSTRSLSRELAPPALNERGLSGALHWLTEWARQRYELQVKLDIAETAEPESEAMRKFLYDIVRELLLNVVKHAGTDQVEITVSQSGEILHLQVEDFGKGFQPQDISTGKVEEGFGLASLSGRLALLGGEVNVDSTPGKGTRVQLRVPLKGDLNQEMP